MSSRNFHLPPQLDREWHAVAAHSFFGLSLLAFVLQNLGDVTLDSTRRLILVALLALSVGNFTSALTTKRSRDIYKKLTSAIEWINIAFAVCLVLTAIFGDFPPTAFHTSPRSPPAHRHGHPHREHGRHEEESHHQHEGPVGFAQWILDHQLLSKRFSGFGFASSGSGVAFGLYSAVLVLILSTVNYHKRHNSSFKVRDWIDKRITGQISLTQSIALAEANFVLGTILLVFLPMNLQQPQLIRIFIAAIGLASLFIPLKADNPQEFITLAFPIYLSSGIVAGWFSISSILFPQIAVAPSFLFWVLVGILQLLFSRMYVSKLPESVAYIKRD